MKRWMMVMALCMASWGSQAQEMATLFVAMPDQQIPQLEDAWRKDLVDLFQQGKEARVQNTMNGFSSLKQLTADYLLLQVTERSTVEMKLLPLVNNTKVVCVVTTVFGPEERPIFLAAKIMKGMLKHKAVTPIGKPSGKKGSNPFVT